VEPNFTPHASLGHGVSLINERENLTFLPLYKLTISMMQIFLK
jgi:hypothetical protein